ncbi:MAG: DUF6470 family protein [Eubacteriales bacterium]
MQMIELQIVPAQIELRRTDAKLEYVNASAQQKMSRNPGGVEIQTKAAKVHVDTYQTRKSIGEGFMTVGDHIEQYAAKGNSVADQATSKFASRGQQQMKAKLGQEMLTQFARQDSFKNVSMNIGIDFIPKVAPTVTVEPGEIDIQFQPDELQFDWDITEQELKFTPGSIELEMTQRPDVIVRYVGGPMYVPKSSDPNYSG